MENLQTNQIKTQPKPNHLKEFFDIHVQVVHKPQTDITSRRKTYPVTTRFVFSRILFNSKSFCYFPFFTTHPTPRHGFLHLLLHLLRRGNHRIPNSSHGYIGNQIITKWRPLATTIDPIRPDHR